MYRYRFFLMKVLKVAHVSLFCINHMQVRQPCQFLWCINLYLVNNRVHIHIKAAEKQRVQEEDCSCYQELI